MPAEPGRLLLRGSGERLTWGAVPGPRSAAGGGTRGRAFWRESHGSDRSPAGRSHSSPERPPGRLGGLDGAVVLPGAVRSRVLRDGPGGHALPAGRLAALRRGRPGVRVLVRPEHAAADRGPGRGGG